VASDQRGRPRSSSREALEEAATELFLEHGYQNTTVDDIAARAGVSRATFFNYFPTKSAVLWVGVDRALDQLERALGTGASLEESLGMVAEAFGGVSLPLIASQAEAMNTGEDVLSEAGKRIIMLARLVAGSSISPDRVWSTTGAIVGACLEWARAGVSRKGLPHYLGSHKLI
jgi:AcrR family transcriptional regulator